MQDQVQEPTSTCVKLSGAKTKLHESLRLQRKNDSNTAHNHRLGRNMEEPYAKKNTHVIFRTNTVSRLKTSQS